MALVLYDYVLQTTNGKLKLGNISPVVTSGMDISPATFKLNYDYNGGAFDLAGDFNATLWGSTSTKTITLSNGNYIVITIDKSASGSRYNRNWNAKLYTASDVFTGIDYYHISDTTNDTGISCTLLLLFLGYNTSDANYVGFMDYHEYSNSDRLYVAWYSSRSKNDTYFQNWVDGSVTVLYNWTAWDQIAGNNGRYRCNLTMVSDGTVEDIGTSIQRGRSYFSRITTASSIYSIIQNTALGEEHVIAYSGAARMTLTVNAGTQNVSRQLVYKFYLDQISETTPIYSATQTIYLAGDSPTADVLLSFVYDPENTVAAFLPIEKVYYQDSEQFIFGGISPTDDELLYMLYWLNESQRGNYPYDTGTNDNGGNPSGPQPGDHIDAPGVPTLGGMSTGMFTVYCPNDTQLVQIAQFLWSDNVLDNIKKYFNNFADNIIALYVLPCKPATLPFKNFKVGNMVSDTITDVEYLTQRFAQIDMGSVYIKNTFDSYLDYSPFTKFEIYLPGIGMQTLSADDIMCPTDPDTGELIENTEGSVISVKYNIDLMTGILVALVMINGELRYQFPGKIGYTIPLTGENYSNIARGFVTAASGLIGAVATGGLSAPLTAGGVSAAVSGTVNAMKPEIHRGGNLTGDASMLGEKSPYLVYHRPNKPLLKNQERYTGFPSYKSGALSEFSGLTQVIDAHIDGISCTEAERAEILNLLKGGVIL